MKFSIKCHLLIRIAFRLGTEGRYSVTNGKMFLRVFYLFCRADNQDNLSLLLTSGRVLPKRLSG